MAYLSLTALAQQHLSEVIQAGDIVVDATVGKGEDTLFLANSVGEHGCVFGFDIQTQALRIAAEKLEQKGLSARVRLVHKSHEHLGQYLLSCGVKSVKAIMFNLGYLPGGDKSLVTNVASTLMAVDAGITLLAPGGMMSVVIYTGHCGGVQEFEALTSWWQQLPEADFRSKIIDTVIPKEHTPRLLLISRNMPV
ncbi:class I SAM-dependent methyltransferase [Kaarinaea lacus]